jgi:hypothetical protein
MLRPFYTWITLFSLFSAISCSENVKPDMSIPNDDTMAILKSSLDSSFVYAKRSIRSNDIFADTNTISAQFILDSVIKGFFERKGEIVLKYIDQKTLCNKAHFLIKKGVRGPYTTGLLTFKKDSSGGYFVRLERIRKVTGIKVVAKDTIYDCDDSPQWTIYLYFSKINNGLRPKVENWAVH